MKNKFISIVLIAVLIIIVITIGILNLNRKNESYITDYDFLYEKAINYLIQNNDDVEFDREGYKQFASYKTFGISTDGEYKYAYMWILLEAYYIQNNQIYNSSGSAMPYKFTFKNNEVIGYTIPEDGSYYASSIKKIFPKDLQAKILKYDSSELNDENDAKINAYYSYLQ